MQGRKSPERSAETGVYVGIDVCKAWLDVHLHPLGQSLRVANTPEGLKVLRRKIAGLPVALIVLEATAKYHRLAHRTLHAQGLAPAPEELEAVQELLGARSAAIAERTALSNRRGASQTAFLKAELARRLKSVASSIARLDAGIEPRVAADPGLKRRYDIGLTIKGVGPVAALALVIGLPELGACSGKAASLLAGLAPVAHDSGESAGQRHIRGGRACARTGLYFAAIAAARYNPGLREDYQRLRAAGKKAKVALTAIMRKLVVLANVLITENREWQPVKP